MKVFITGIRGFVGSHLARALETAGHCVRGSSSDGINLPRIRIGEPVAPEVFGDADTVVHCAHDFPPGAGDLNVSGSRLIFEAAHSRRRIFIGSHSARPDAVSEYGVSKYRIERFWLGEGETVVRPGVVIGAGGGFGAHVKAIRSSRIIPLVDGGRDAVAVIAVADFCRATIGLIESGAASAYNLFNEAEPDMRTIVETVLRLDHRRAAIISIPYGAASLAVSAAERFGLPLSFNSGSLRTMKLNRTRVHRSNLRELLTGETSLDAAIQGALAKLTLSSG